MLQSNIKIAWRQMLKQKLFATIKIGGLAIGVAACLLITLFIQDELAYDQHYVEKDRIYRVSITNEVAGEQSTNVFFPAPFAQTIMDDYPEIEVAARLNPGGMFAGGNNTLQRTDEEKMYFEDGFALFDPALLDILEIKMVFGDAKTALNEPGSIVISQEKSRKYFGDENPVGKTLILNQYAESPLTIGGVMEDFSVHGHLDYDFILTMVGEEFFPGEQTFWAWNNYQTYLRLKEGADVEALKAKLPRIITDHYIPNRLAEGHEDAVRISENIKFFLQPVSDIYLRSDGIKDIQKHGDIRYVRLFGAVALIILLIACINFINLSTAKSANRAKEVGLRKVVGSWRSQLVGQFLTESVLFSVMGFVGGLVLARLFLPKFSFLAEKSLDIPWTTWWFIPSLLIACLITGLLAGIYPAWYLSAFRPADVLKGELSRGSKSSPLRNTLVIVQLTASIILIVGALVIQSQMNYMFNKKLGFEREQVIMLKGAFLLDEDIVSFRQDLVNMPEVDFTSICDFLPVDGTMRNNVGFEEAGEEDKDPIYGQIWRVDHDYIITMGMELAEGRDFDRTINTDSQAVIINRAFAEEMGLQNPLESRVSIMGNTGSVVIGVVEDFHFESLREKIGPLLMRIGHSPSILNVKTNTPITEDLMERIESKWSSYLPDQPMPYAFLDERFEQMYEDVKRTRSIFGAFALLAIIVACLGLFALSSFMVEQRGKEISIRKVLGAPAMSLVNMLTRQFLILIGVSLLIAIPLSWYLMQMWLENFAYKTDLSWGIFALAAIIAFVVTMLTTSIQAFQAAMAEPSKALRR